MFSKSINLKSFKINKNKKKIHNKLKILLSEKNQLIKSFNRQALHATKLSFNHPINNKYLEFSSPLPKDISVLIEDLKV